jgi:glutathione synthase/RimK-type ligase-like ATP-grasp enzyme
MTLVTTAGTRTHVVDPVALIGVAALAKMAFDCIDLSPLQQSLTDRFLHDAGDTAALMDLSAIKQLYGARADGLQLQAQALRQNRLYRRRPATAESDAIRLLAFVAPGDFMANAPLEFLLDGSNITLDLLYVVPGAPPPAVIPEHDVAIVAVGESDDNRAVLREVASLIRDWKRPVLNAPSRIAELSRDAACSLLLTASGTAIPTTLRVAREILEHIGMGTTAVEGILAGGKFPIIARPIGSHAGDGLSKLDDASAVVDYLQGRPEEEFYISPFVDYRSADGLFRKYRIALIDGQPYACHMAVSQHWMVHYLNAGMTESAAKRDEEARFMAAFDDDFAVRHRVALHVIAERVGLAYFAIDCGELPDGSLLLFEADVAMIVHAMDPPDMFPYKGPQMRKVFAAFAAMLRKYAQPAAA